mmetsp:Transcript_17569/g.40817  ORF Transcript_17569/g.40817 Transcript_17569/m.40817 type:complete len:279 (+) Transcript_17569:284-1120(+)
MQTQTLPSNEDNLDFKRDLPVARARTSLPLHFIPGDYDVICGRGKDCYNHTGNRRFRIAIDMALKRYSDAGSKLQKSLIVMSIVDMFRSNSRFGGGFVRQDRASGLWYEIGDEAAREKVGQTIREALVQQDPEKRARKRMKRAESNKARAKKMESTPWPDATESQARRVSESSVGTTESKLDSVTERRDSTEPKPMLVKSQPSEDKLGSCSIRPSPVQSYQGTFTPMDEMLAAVPPQLTLESSRDWFTPPNPENSDSDDCSDLPCDDEFDRLFEISST